MAGQHPPPGGQSDGELEAGARAMAERAKATAKDEVRDLKVQGRDVAEQVKRAAEGEIDRRSTKLADGLDAVGHAMRLAAEDLEGEGQDWLADYTRRAAGQVERVTRYLHDEDAPAMLADLEDMARENPGTFLGTSFAAGVAAGRFLRSSRPEYERGRQNGRQDAALGSGTARATTWDEHATPLEHERRR